LIVLVSLIAVVIAVGIHHEALVVASLITRRSSPRRFRPGLAVLVALMAHLLEITFFGGVWWLLIDIGMAELSLANPTPLDLVYFSGAVYTSLGFGDIAPLGEGRVFSVIETVTGLVLIAWTASFTYLEMRRNWDGVE
jgi:hypothetical protein